ncbi:hypothetical protein GTQ99_16420 [Kineococcus sp. T13]|uniref:VOC family protein n=1 Tax=Kineococcus vitellinus TaxID=2696565 RepID=UPI00141351A9|nr:VOC family protein [Kineococcus vitellinus]NAZ76994.1 hypothetical protein [Kineococcus vitellinus]
MSTTVQVAFDAADPHGLAAFWSLALGCEREDHHDVVEHLVRSGLLPAEGVLEVEGRKAFRDVAACRSTTGGPRLFFQRVPEPKTAKNRVHLDLQVGAEQREAEVERLVALGAAVLWTTTDRGPVTTTLRDPEGNEFCVS